MRKIIIGLNHKSANVEIRELFCLKPAEQIFLLSQFKSDPSIVECLILSTCNRTEIYVSAIDDQGVIDRIFLEILKIKNLVNKKHLMRYFYIYQDGEAVLHLLKVAAGLDSLILGESQILGQFKLAVKRSQKIGMLWKHFNILSNMAIRVGKKVRSETDIGIGGVSVSWAAVNLAEEKLGTLKGKSLLIIGSGKMAHLAGSALTNKNLSHVYVMNRTYAHAVDLAGKINGSPVGFWDIKNILRQVDVCICSAGAPHYIIEKEMLKDVLGQRSGRKLLLIDISMPRNIDPEVQQLSGINLVSIDQLGQLIEENLSRRQQSVEDVMRIIGKKTKAYQEKIDALDKLSETMSSLRVG